MTLYFGELPVGTDFEFFGKRYRKIALSMTKGEDGLGHVFMGEALVMVEHEPSVRLPWKPDPIYWADRLSPAPGQA